MLLLRGLPLVFLSLLMEEYILVLHVLILLLLLLLLSLPDLYILEELVVLMPLLHFLQSAFLFVATGSLYSERAGCTNASPS